MKASFLISNGVFLLSAVRGAKDATGPASPETQVSESNEEQLDITTSRMMSIVAADFEVMDMDGSFHDPGGHSRPTVITENQDQAFHGSDDYTQPQARAHPKYVMVKCHNQDLQNVCRNPPFNTRCTEECESTTIYAMMMDRPHEMCESECTCIAGDTATIPTSNEFADLE